MHKLSGVGVNRVNSVETRQNTARVALFALAIQFALSFGHFHGIARRRRRGSEQLTQATIASATASPAKDARL